MTKDYNILYTFHKKLYGTIKEFVSQMLYKSELCSYTKSVSFEQIIQNRWSNEIFANK
ncbi:unnamed protein product (macronuclear) [Paramecium tetraurelia]|uniref:Uncharacterized protein n=1 Tax=Paramecium tetraurelia TaxID=5888 RepID=A0CML7_PARTE|nr:uncharacterized protein GSPATT00008513001 [Paramecium tetraurelia]CAK72034.1 unnamed protein product [Paramecium tetraurelia]|eukprot:XP_001439431.1 hypothetical protein (macronuclear) [Paramecium tetraurelia strain d4-2]